MKKSHAICAITIVTMSVMFIRCNSLNDLQSEALGNVIFHEGFESGINFDSIYFQFVYYPGQFEQPGQEIMSVSTLSKHSGNASLTSYDTCTSIDRFIEPSIDDSIAGLQFYMMATKKSHANTFVGICRHNGMSWKPNELSMEMGIDQSDSLQYINELNPPFCNRCEYKNFAPLELNKWYKCKIEYNYIDTTITYSVDDHVVHKSNAPKPSTIDCFFVRRDELGSSGSSGYYIDDITVYKR